MKGELRCRTCTEAVNAINGRYCIRLKRYVEHISVEACEVSNKPYVVNRTNKSNGTNGPDTT